MWSSIFIMVGKHGDVGTVGLDATSEVLARLRPDGVLIDCTNSSPPTRRLLPRG
uniref:6-phosphogluconate dehydrogenase NADP-binding domain-containing protein n=1 Tax=Aegilops tauschii subsp. strangulata TaxID=200361 RepID=A0A453L040_AEGTS